MMGGYEEEVEDEVNLSARIGDLKLMECDGFFRDGE